MRARAFPALILSLWLVLAVPLAFTAPARAGDVGALREMLAELKLELQEATATLARDVQVEAMLEALFDARELVILVVSDALTFAEEDTVLDEDTLLLIKDAYDIITEILEELDFTVDFILPGLGEMLQEFAEKKAEFEDWIDPDQLGRKRARLIMRSLAGADKVLGRIEDAKKLENLEKLLDEDIRQPLEKVRDLLHDILEDGGWLGPLALLPDLGSNSAGSDSSFAVASNTISINAANLPPKADFTFTPAFPEVNQEVQFTDQSSDPDGSVTAWKWEFDDGTTSTEKNPKHKFGTKRKYNVKLTVTDNGGATNSITKIVPVGFKPPVAKFTYSPERPKEGQVIQFTDQSTDPDGTVVAWSWDFGDGNTSPVKNPKYVYAKAGSYKVKLTVTDNDGFTNSYTATVTVEAPPELEQILEALDEADMLLEAAEGQLARALRLKAALSSDFKRIEGFLLRIDRSLEVRERLDRRSSLGEEVRVDLASSSSASAVAVEVRTSPSGSGVEFRVRGLGVMAVQVQLFDLAGRAILERKAGGSALTLRPLEQGSAPLANGVYLYVVTAYSSDGKRLWTKVGKVIILR